MKVIDFLKDYDIELGKLDTDQGPDVERGGDQGIKLNDENISKYRENGIDEFVSAAIDFNRNHIEDGQGNLFGDTVYDPAVTAYYAAIPEELAPVIAELFIKNTGGSEECEEKETEEEVADCYIRQIFDTMVSAGLLRSFPVFTGTLSGAPVPIFNILPNNSPSNLQKVFLSSLVPLGNNSIFSEVSFDIQSTEFNQENRWVYTLPSDEISDENKQKLKSIFEPKNSDIVYEIPTSDPEEGPEEVTPSKSALLFETDVEKVESEDDDEDEKVVDDEYAINVSYPGFSNVFNIEKGKQFYVLNQNDDEATVLVKLPVFVAQDPLELSGPKASNFKEIRKYGDAPFFEKDGKWFFVAEEQQTQNINNVAVKSAKIFDPPEFDISNIQDKARNEEYEGFGATKFNANTGQTTDVSSGKSLLEDFFLFYKDYLEQNFAVIHVGITSNGAPAVSSPEQLKVTLEE